MINCTIQSLTLGMILGVSPMVHMGGGSSLTLAKVDAHHFFVPFARAAPVSFLVRSSAFVRFLSSALTVYQSTASFAIAAEMHVEHSLFDHCIASYGGGFSVVNSGTVLYVNDCEFDACNTTSSRSGIIDRGNACGGSFFFLGQSLHVARCALHGSYVPEAGVTIYAGISAASYFNYSTVYTCGFGLHGPHDVVCYEGNGGAYTYCSNATDCRCSRGWTSVYFRVTGSSEAQWKYLHQFGAEGALVINLFPSSTANRILYTSFISCVSPQLLRNGGGTNYLENCWFADITGSVFGSSSGDLARMSECYTDTDYGAFDGFTMIVTGKVSPQFAKCNINTAEFTAGMGVYITVFPVLMFLNLA